MKIVFVWVEIILFRSNLDNCDLPKKSFFYFSNFDFLSGKKREYCDRIFPCIFSKSAFG
jgi:hypothetical protein